MMSLFGALGLTTGVTAPAARSRENAAYRCDVIHATNNELGFDYLRDNILNWHR
jgi:preprotein translocase subunit SecA